jgi:hypothetical protein
MCIFVHQRAYQVKLILVFTILVLSCFTVHGQNFFEKQLDHFFPNRKSKQIERLEAKTDSLKRANDSLSASVNVAAEKIVHLKKEIIALKGDVFSEKESARATRTQLEKEVSELLDSISRINYTLITCSEEIQSSNNNAPPVVINTCLWRTYKFIEKGTPDSKGRYLWSTEIFDIKTSAASKLSNVDLFKAEKIAELEKMINQRFEEDYTSFKSGSPGCFYNKKAFEPIPLSKMRIALNDNSEMIFEADFGLAEACFSISSSSTGFKINELREFLK